MAGNSVSFRGDWERRCINAGGTEYEENGKPEEYCDVCRDGDFRFGHLPVSICQGKWPGGIPLYQNCRTQRNSSN